MNRLTDLYNEEAENTIVGICLVANDKAKTILSTVKPLDFYDKRNKIIMKTINQMLNEHKVADIVSVSERLKFDGLLDQAGGRDYINELASNIITTSNYKNYLKIIVKYSKKRSLLSLSEQIKIDIDNGKDVDDIAKDLKSDLTDIVLAKDTTQMVNLFSGFDTVIDKVDKILTSEGGTFGLQTGIKELDLITNGLCASKLYILGARPAMGKSALAQQIGEYVSQDKNVLYVSLEMGVDEFTERSLLSKCGLNKEMLSRKMIGREEALSKLAQGAEEIANLKLFIDDRPRCTLEELEQSIIKCKQNNGSCDLIIIDYLQLMGIKDRRIYDSKDIVSQLSQGLKALSREYKVPILALSQLSRQLEGRMDKRPLLSDLRESGSIEQDADVVMFLYRQEVYSKNPIDKAKAEIIIAKNRDGRIGTINMIFNASRVKFTEVKK